MPQKTPQTSKKSQVLSSDEESSDDYDFNQQAKKKPRPADKKTVLFLDAIFACNHTNLQGYLGHKKTPPPRTLS